MIAVEGSSRSDYCLLVSGGADGSLRGNRDSAERRSGRILQLVVWQSLFVVWFFWISIFYRGQYWCGRDKQQISQVLLNTKTKHDYLAMICLVWTAAGPAAARLTWAGQWRSRELRSARASCSPSTGQSWTRRRVMSSLSHVQDSLQGASITRQGNPHGPASARWDGSVMCNVYHCSYFRCSGFQILSCSWYEGRNYYSRYK